MSVVRQTITLGTNALGQTCYDVEGPTGIRKIVGNVFQIKNDSSSSIYISWNSHTDGFPLNETINAHATQPWPVGNAPLGTYTYTPMTSENGTVISPCGGPGDTPTMTVEP